nr:magnesium transporter [Natroniella sulfidigena]
MSKKNPISLIRKYVKNKQIEKLNDLVENNHPSDIAEIINDLDIELIIKFFKFVTSDYSADVLIELDSTMRVEVIYALDEGEVQGILKELPLDDKLDIINRLTDEYKAKIIRLLTEDKEKILRILNYDAESAANQMTTDFIKAEQSSKVEETIKGIRKQGEDAEIIYYIYVVDKENRLVGILSLRELLLANPNKELKEIMNHDLNSIELTTDQERVAHLMAKYDLIALPVVDTGGHILGIVTIDDIVDVIHQESSEDIFKQAGFTEFGIQEADYSSNLIYGTLSKVVKTRLPWLLVVLVGGLIAGGVIEQFEATLESIVALAFFIPVIMDMGGNVGTQSSTIFVRGVVLGHIEIEAFYKYLRKEISVGATIGLLSSLFVGGSAYLWQNNLALALTTGLSMFFTILLASAVGFIIPWLLIKFGRDSAAASDPLITTVKDITGLLIYFGFANLFMNYLS